MITAVSWHKQVSLAQSGNEVIKPDTVNSVVTAAAISIIGGITGVVNANEMHTKLYRWKAQIRLVHQQLS